MSSIFKKKKIKLGLIVLVLIGVVAFMLTRKKSDVKGEYQEVSVKKTDYTETILSTGTVSPENRLDIKPPVAGRVEKLLVEEGKRVKRGQVLAWISSTERAAMLDSARGEGEASLKQWEQFYKATPIYAPIDGIIIVQNIQVGQSFAVSDAILTMSDRLTVKAQVDETDIAKIKLGQRAGIMLDAYPEEKTDAKVVHIGFDAKTVNSVTSYVVDVLPVKVPKHMLSGMTANVTFILNQLPGALMIPTEAISTKNGTGCVRLKPAHPDDAIECSKISFSPSQGPETVVTSGLSEGQVILVPQYKNPGQKDQNAKNPFSPMGSGRRH